MKEILMIHEVTPQIMDFLEKNGENYILTFDDGLYSQYFYFDRIKKINTEKYFFISTAMVHKGKHQIVGITCRNAHKLFFEKAETSAYMNWDQIEEIDQTTNCFIGGHSHFHKNLSQLNLKDKIDWLKQDTKKMNLQFMLNLDKKPKYYCLPYNYDYQGLLSSMLKKDFHFEQIFGKGRIKIEELLK